MSNFIFNPPAGWPTPPAGWKPVSGWKPDPSWPPAPVGWVFWVAEETVIEPVTYSPPEPNYESPLDLQRTLTPKNSAPALPLDLQRTLIPSSSAPKPPTLQGPPAPIRLGSPPISPPPLPQSSAPSPRSALSNQPAPIPNETFESLGVSEPPRKLPVDNSSQAALLKVEIDQIIDSTRKLTPAIRQNLFNKISDLVSLQTQALDDLKRVFVQDVELYNKIQAVDNARSFNRLLLEKKQALDTFKFQEDQAIAEKVQELANVQFQIDQLKSELLKVNTEVTLQEVSLHEYFNPAENSIDLRKELDQTKTQVKAMVAANRAVKATSGFRYNDSVKEGAKFVKDFSSLMLTAYNQEIENTIVKSARGKDIYAALERADKASNKVEKMGSMLDMSIDSRYHALRRREIELAFKYKEKDAQEKEEEKLRRAEQREEEKIIREAELKAKEILREEKALLLELKAREDARELQRQQVLKEIEASRIAGLDKEETHYRTVLAQLSIDDPSTLEIKIKLNKVESAKETNSNILANSKAGYVYVISNVGSFGEGVVKIGLTRRTEPMDRVKELGDASVPFLFDVHIMHFSDDAVTLEKALHHMFAKQAINKVNPRKEFFRVKPEEVRDALNQLSKGALLTFNETPEAADYRMTLKLEEADNN